MKKNQHKVTIKGTKDGLLFLMNDTCAFDELIKDLRDKIENSHQQILTGPLIKVTLKLGNRFLTPEQEQMLRDTIGSRGNLEIEEMDSDVISKEQAWLDLLSAQVKIETRTVRSGQVIEHNGDLLMLGDINPGGCIRSEGNIFVMGAMRGIAHAGAQGDQEAIIAASILQPTQLRIADVMSRPPDEWLEEGEEMEFVYLDNGQMAIDRINQLYSIRPTLRKRN